MRAFFVCLLIAILYNPLTAGDSLVIRKPWSVEISVVWPVFPGIYKVQFAREIWHKKTFAGEAGLGLNIQPERYNDNEGYFSEEFVNVFYRQYFWKGLHIQLETNFAYGRLKDHPPAGTNHESYAIFHDFTAGYKFQLLRRKKIGLSIIPQAGGGFTSYVNSGWPVNERPYWLANLLVGIIF